MPKRLTTLSIEPMEYDPANPTLPPTHILVTSITETLFLRSLESFWRTVEKFTEMNQKKLNYPPLGGEGFTYMGAYYRCPNAPITRSGILPALHSDFEPQFSKIMKMEEQSENDKGRLRMFITALLLPCESWQDIRDALPDYIIDVIKNLNRLPRTREIGFTMMSNPRTQRSFENHIETLEFYSTIRMVT